MPKVYLKHETLETTMVLETNQPEKVLKVFEDQGYEEISQEEHLEIKRELGLVGVGENDYFDWEEYFYGGDDE